MAQVNKKFTLAELRQNAQVVIRTGRDNNIDKIILPNPVTIGLEENNLRSLLTANGSIKISSYTPGTITSTLYNVTDELWFSGMPLIRGGLDSQFYFEPTTNMLTLTGTFSISGSLTCNSMTGSLTQLPNGDAFIQAGSRITVTTGTLGEVVITADVQDTGVRATTTITAIETIPANLNTETIQITDANSHTVTFNYNNTIALATPSRTSAISYVIGCSDVSNVNNHALAIYNALILALGNNDLLVNSVISGDVISLQQVTGGTIGNTQITGTAVTAVDVIVGNSGYFVGGANVSGDVSAHYLVLTSSSNLNNERVLTPSLGLTGTSGIPGSTYTLSIDTSVVPVLSASNVFTGQQTFTSGILGTHQYLQDGLPAFLPGANVQIGYNANGSITISSTDTNSTYTNGAGLSLTGNQFAASLYANGGLRFLSNKLAVNPVDFTGTGLKVSSDYIVIDDNIVATVSGTTFTGAVKFNQGLSGSLTQLQNGLSYLVANGGITITSSSNGQIIISGSAASGTTYTAGSGLILTGTQFEVSLKPQGGLKFDVTEVALRLSDITGSGIIEDSFGRLAINDNIVATVSGTTFTGAVSFTAGLSGSLTHLTDGSSYIIAGDNITVTTASNGSLTISAISLGGSGGTSIRLKDEYVITSSHPSNTQYDINQTDLNVTQYRKEEIDIVYNGSLLLSGTQEQVGSGTVDYSLVGSSSLVFAFELLPSDIIQTIILYNSSTLSSGTSAGGSDTHVQFNDSGLLSGSSNFTFNKTTNTVNTINLSSVTLTGSLTRLSNGDPYITSSGSILQITTGVNGDIILSDILGSAPFVLYTTSSTLPDAHVLTSSNGIIIDNSVPGFTNISIERTKLTYVVTGTHQSNNALTITGLNFFNAGFDENRIDIYVNGALLTSGSGTDYLLVGNSTDILMSFDLLANDIVTVVTQ